MKKLLLLTLATLFTSNAMANSSPAFKMAVLKGSDGAAYIHEGNYEKGIESIVTSSPDAEFKEQLTKQLNLCVAYASSRQFTMAKETCDNAIVLSKNFVEVDSSASRLVSIALNNRAVLKTKTQDYKGALEDFKAAAEIKKTSFVESNLSKLILDQIDNIEFRPLQLTQL
jgi:tetratricopeptide (TPR) repeat protein